MPSSARQDMIASAMLLFRERGIEGTAFSDVLAHSGAPRGSIYHHFPGGKTQLAEEATEAAGRLIARGIEQQVADGDPLSTLDAFVAVWREALESSDYDAGCPVVAAALVGHEAPSVRDAAGAVFARWQQLLASGLEQRGLAAERAASLATLLVGAIEGAIVLCRSERTITPLERTRDELRLVLESALGPPAR